MKRLNEKLRIAGIMLEKLEEGLIRWTPLMKAVVKESSSPWKAQVIIKWLLTNGYISRLNVESTRSQKMDENYCVHYDTSVKHYPVSEISSTVGCGNSMSSRVLLSARIRELHRLDFWFSPF